MQTYRIVLGLLAVVMAVECAQMTETDKRQEESRSHEDDDYHHHEVNPAQQFVDHTAAMTQIVRNIAAFKEEVDNFGGLAALTDYITQVEEHFRTYVAEREQQGAGPGPSPEAPAPTGSVPTVRNLKKMLADLMKIAK